MRLDFLAASLSDENLSHVEWHVHSALQHLVGQYIPVRPLATRLGMKHETVGAAIRSLVEKGYVQVKEPTERNPDGSLKEARKLLAITKHRVAGAASWISIPGTVTDAYGGNKAASLRLRLHGLQMLVQRERRQPRDPKKIPKIGRKATAARLGGLDPENDADLQRIKSAHDVQRALGYLEQPIGETRRRLRIGKTRRRIVGATDKQFALAGELVAQNPSLALHVVHEIAPSGPIPINPFLDALRAAKRNNAIIEEDTYRFEHGIGIEPIQLDEDALIADLDGIDSRDSFGSFGRIRWDRFGSFGRTSSSSTSVRQEPKRSSLRDQENEIDVGGDRQLLGRAADETNRGEQVKCRPTHPSRLGAGRRHTNPPPPKLGSSPCRGSSTHASRR